VLEALECEERHASIETAAVRYLPRALEAAHERLRNWPSLVAKCAKLIEDMDRGHEHRSFRPREDPGALKGYPDDVIREARRIVRRKRLTTQESPNDPNALPF